MFSPREPDELKADLKKINLFTRDEFAFFHDKTLTKALLKQQI